MNKTKEIWLKTSLFFFTFAAALGVHIRTILLGTGITGTEHKYFNFLQAHSHISFLGWVYLAIVTGLIYIFLDNKKKSENKYKILNGITIFALAGIPASFIFQGYGAVSIGFLIFFLVLSYVFVVFFYRDLKKKKNKGLPEKFIKTGLFYYLLSSAALWGFGPIMVFGLGKTTIYFLAIYFYLHFLYNGFIVFSLFGLLLKYFEKKDIRYSQKRLMNFYWLMNIACIPAFALSALWIPPPNIVYIIGAIAGLLQLFALYNLYPVFHIIFSKKRKIFKGIVSVLFKISILSFFLKVFFQFLSALPYFAEKAFQTKSYVIIGYIHLVTLGFISPFLLAWFIKNKGFFVSKNLPKVGLWLFITGFLGSEFLLFTQGLLHWEGVHFIPNYSVLLLSVSSLMLLGLFLFFISQFIWKND